MSLSRFLKPLSSLLVFSLLFTLIGAAGIAFPRDVQAAGVTVNLDQRLNNMDSATNQTGDTTGTAGIALVANSDPAFVREGTGSKKWLFAIPDAANPPNHVAGSALIYPKHAPNVDLNGFTTLKFWAYNVKARSGDQADKPFQIRFFMKGDASNYYFYRIPLDWTGWKQIEVPLSAVKTQMSSPSVKAWGPLDYLRFDQAGIGGTTLDATLQMYLDDFRVTGTGNLLPAVADKPSGTYMNKVKVNVASASAPAGLTSLSYKRLGIDVNFLPYTGTLELTEDTELVVKSTLNGVDSEETTYSYNVEIDPDYVGEVMAAPAAGTYAEAKTVTLSAETEDAQIFYKYEDEDDSAYRLYSAPITVGDSATIVAKAVSGGNESELSAYSYLIDLSGASSFPISDTESFTGWTNTSLSTEHPVLGTRSGLWTDPTVPIDINNIAGTAWKSYDQIEFWLYSEKASNKKVYFVLYANDPATPANEYFMTSFFVDWTGWKKIELPYNKFLNSTGTADLDKITKLIIHPRWYGSDPAPDPTDKLYFDGLGLAKNVVEPSIKQISQSALPGSVLHYSLSLKNIGEAASAYQLSAESTFGAGYDVSFDDLTETVAIGAETDIDFEVQVPENATPGENRKAVFVVQPVSGGKVVKLELNVSVGAKRVATKEHPYIMTTGDRLEEAKAKIENDGWAADYLDAIQAKADAWLDREVYYPTKPAGQTTWFVCGDVTLTFNYDWPHSHLCEADGQYYTGDQVDAGWRFTTHTMNTEAARTLAIVYALTGESAYAEKAKEILVRYSELYPSYPVQAQYGKLFYQTLDEAVQMIQLVQAYDLIKPSGLLNDAETYGIEQNLFAASAKTLQGYDVGKSNWQTWHNAAIGAIGAALEDRTLMDFSVLGRSGFDYQMANSVLSDGFWYEGAIGYHFYAQSALFFHAQSLKEMGYDLFGDASFKKTFDATLRYAYPDLGIINSNDSGKYPTNLGAPGRVVPMDYEGVYAEYEDATYGALLNKLYVDNGRPRGGHIVPGNTSSGIAGEQAVFYGKPTIAGGGSLPSESLNFEGLGHSVLRVGEGNDQQFALVDYGLHGGYHGHPDKLHLDLFGKGERLAPDLGIPPYSNSMYTSYYKKTFSHNTVAVDGKTQNIPNVNNVEVYEPTKMYLPSEGFGIMTNTSSKAYDNMNKYERTVAVTPDYTIDLFSVESATERQYDWILRGIGEFDTDAEMEDMEGPLGTEDAYSFFRNGQSAEVDDVWEGKWNTAAGNGLKLFSLTSSEQQPTTMIVGESPGPGNDTGAYTPMVVNRVNARNAQFVSILEPFSGTSKIQSARKLGSDKIELRMVDGRTHLFVYHSEAPAAGELQYAFVEGTELDSEEVAITTSISGDTVNVALNEQEETVDATIVIYAPGAAKVVYDGEEVSFTSNNDYVMVKVTQETEQETTPPTETTGPTPTPTPSSTTAPTASPSPTPAATPTSTPKATPTPTPTATPAPTTSPKPQPPFKDVDKHWAKNEIEEAVRLGIAQGFGDGSFKPEQSVSREQIIVMIMNAMRPGEEPSTPPAFTDRDQISTWAAKAIALADELGLMSGFEDGSFRPKAELTRAQLAVLLARAIGAEPSEGADGNDYADEASIPSWALPATRLLQELGIMTGRAGNRFAPNETVSRAEAITAILRWIHLRTEAED